MTRFVTNYRERHRHIANQLLHLVGVPLTFVVSVVFLIRQQPLIALACFLGGYLLQFIGHAIEGNDAGEIILIKRLLNKPYVEFGPLSKSSSMSKESSSDD